MASHPSSTAYEPRLRPRDVDVFEQDPRAGSRARASECTRNICVASKVTKCDVVNTNRLSARIGVLANQVDVNRFRDLMEHKVFKDDVVERP